MRRILLLLFLSPALLFGQVVDRVDAVNITVSDMRTALAFYTTVLPFKVVNDIEVSGREFELLKGNFGIRYRKVRLQLGEEQIELTDFLTAGGRPIPIDSKSNDLWFQHIAIVVSDMDSAYAWLRKHGVEHVSTGPQTLPKTIPAAEGIRAFYFHDPDNHNLELIYFPKGKGNPKWQGQKNLFLGIDHTAIGVRNTADSRKFYDALGITYQGESRNFGTEQEHLNNVQGARLHITGNKAKEGMGVEFLEYEVPTNGRSYPSEARGDDLIRWETIVTASEIDALYQKLSRQRATFISSIVNIPSSSEYGFRKGFYVRDPDGHVLGIFSK